MAPPDFANCLIFGNFMVPSENFAFGKYRMGKTTNNAFHQAARALSTSKGVCLSSFESLKDLPSPSSDVISTDSTEPVEFVLSTQNQSQEATKLTDLSIEQPIPANKEGVSAETSPLLEKNAADEKEGGAELSSEKKGNALMTDPGLFDLDNMDDTLQKRLIIKGANQPKSADMPKKTFPKSKHCSLFRSFSDTWYNVKIGKETVHRNWISYSPSKDSLFCHFCMFFGKGNK
eukprot:gene1000-316_t